MNRPLLAAAFALGLSAAAFAQAPSSEAPSTQVVTVVTVPVPPGVDEARLAAGMRASVDQYRQVPGLVRKYFTIGEGNFGGVYLWKDRASAEAWFNAAWHERVIKTYGRDGTIVTYSVPVAVEGAQP